MCCAVDGLSASLCAECCWPSDVRAGRTALPRTPKPDGNGERIGDAKVCCASCWPPDMRGAAVDESDGRLAADIGASRGDERERRDDRRGAGTGMPESAGVRLAEETEASGVDGCAAVEEADERRLCAGCRPSSCWRYRSLRLGRAAVEVFGGAVASVLAEEC